MQKALLCSLALALATAYQLAAQCNFPSPPGTGAQGCQNAPLFCSEEDMDGYCSTTGATGAGACPSAFCGTCENSHWLSFIAGGTVVTLTISPSNCAGQPSGTGLQAQLFATTNCTNFTAVSNCDGAGQAIPITLTAMGLTIGEVYYLLIDGWGGDECDYEIDVTEGIGNLPPPIIPGIISGPTNVCPGASVNYTVPSGTGVTLYDWSISPAIGLISNDGSNSITVDFTAQGIAQLCVTPSNACEAGPTICKSIISTPIPPQLEIVNFCLGETWTCQGQTYSAPGTNAVVYDSWMGCDSTRICVGIAAPPNPIPAPVYATICQGEIYQQGESEYDETGQYTDTLTASSNGCDSIQTLILTVLQAEAVIAPPGVLGCGGSSTLVLDGTGTTYIPGAALSYFWSGPGIVSGGNTLTPTVNQTGTYCLTVTHTYQGVTCSDTECVVVQGIFIPPNQPSLSGPINACTGATSTFIVLPSGTGLQPAGFTWTLTGGAFSGSGDTITVTWTEAGLGTVCVTADNSCGSSPQACLNVDISDDPIIMPPVEATICQGESYNFAGNDYDSTGIYTLTLQSFTGCDSIVTLELTVLQAEAVIAPPGVLGEGGNTALVLDGTGSTAIPADSNAVLSYLWTGPGLLSGDSTLNPLIDSSGVYCLEVSHIYQGVSCSDLTCVTVTSITDPPLQPTLAGPSNSCLGTNSDYTVTPSGSGLPATGFTWTVTGGTFTTNTNGDTIAVMWTAAGQGQVCVTADNANGPSLQTCLTVNIQDNPIVMPPALVAICEGESYNFAGNSYETTGVYSVTLASSQSCDSIVTLDLTTLQAEAVIAPPGELNCTATTLVLDGVGSTLIPDAPGAVIYYLWIGPGIISGGNTLTPTISEPGIYTLIVTQTYLGATCLGQASVTVTADNEPPLPPFVSGPQGACTETTSTFTVSPSGGPAPTGFTWIVTGGTFTTNGNEITVTWTTPGQGLVCAAALYDCGASSTACHDVEVLDTPLAQFGFEQAGAQLTFTDESSGATSWLWDFGDGNTSSEQNPVHTYGVDGVYVITLTVSNGICDHSFSQSVEIVVGAFEIFGLTTFTLNPSISSGLFTLTVSLRRAADLEISVVNTQGQIVHKMERLQTAYLQDEVNLAGMAQGVYFVQLTAEGKKAVRKLVLTR